MTQPPNYNPYGNNEDENKEPQDNSASNFPPYPSTPHPEDQPQGFPGPDSTGPQYPGYNDYGTGYSQQGQPGYHGYAQGYQGNGGQPAAGQLVRGDGRVDIMMAVRFGFKSVFSNALIWILGTVIFFFLLVAISSVISLATVDPNNISGATVTGDIANFLVSAVSIVFSVLLYTGALKQVDKPKIKLRDFWEELNFWPTFGVLVIIGVVAGLVGGILVALTIAPTLMSGEVPGGAEVIGMILGMLVLFLVILLVTPLYSYMAWYAADRREGFLGSIKHGFRDGARNYLKLLAYNVIAGLLMFVGAIVTLGLAIIILAPASLLISAHIYRQIAGEPFRLA
ncbi:hypothetical protein [Corynebacterium sp. A21]|uniref:hypothetical protein n=1 Tax=Corynebacterium sp. A21 TaxID=3457318 RepID=UPI003FD46BFD